MATKNHEKFQTKIKTKNISGIRCLSWVPDDAFEGFPLLKKDKLFKIYLIKKQDEFLYVGSTSQAILTRIKGGLNAKKETSHGFSGYGWKDEKGELDFFVWCFPDHKYEKGDIKEIVREKRNEIHAIESEIVFKIRTEKGSWPKYQTEIHFYNIEKGNCASIAEKIYKGSK